MPYRIGKPVLAALALCAVAAVAFHPGARERALLAGGKLVGATSHLSWTEVAVRMAPWSWQPRVRDLIGPNAPQWVHPLDYLLELGQLPRKSYPIFLGPTPTMRRLDCHYTVLAAGATPHPPHQHVEAEVIIPISGEVEIIRLDLTESTEKSTERVGPGRLVYHASNQPHTIRGAGTGPSGYVVFRWVGESRNTDNVLESSTFDFRDALQADRPSSQDRARTLIFESPTEWSSQFRCHVSTLKPGAGSSAHRDTHDLVLLVLSGAIETLGRRLEPGTVAFNPAHRTHAIKNVGTEPAQYLVLEFYGPAGG